MDLETFWFCLIAVVWADVLPARGVRLRGRNAASVRPALGRGAEYGSADDRTGLGRERGLARRRRRCHLRRVPGLVRDDVLGLLPRPPAHPRSSSSSASSRSSGARRARRPAGGRRGPGRTRSAASARRCSGASGSSCLVYGVPIDSDGDFTGNLLDLFSPYTRVRRNRCRGALRVPRSDVPHAPHDRRAARPRRGGRAEARDSCRCRLARCILVWTVAVAMDRNDKDLFPPVLPAALGIAALALAIVFLYTGANGRAFAMTATRDDLARCDAVRLALSARDGVEHRLREQPDRRRRRVVALRAPGHDRRGGDLRPARPPVPGVDVLRLPGASRRSTPIARRSRRETRLRTGGSASHDAPRRHPRRRLRRDRRRAEAEGRRRRRRPGRPARLPHLPAAALPARDRPARDDGRRALAPRPRHRTRTTRVHKAPVTAIDLEAREVQFDETGAARLRLPRARPRRRGQLLRDRGRRRARVPDVHAARRGPAQGARPRALGGGRQGPTRSSTTAR